MMRPVAVFVGLRYLRSQRSNNFASFVSMASVIGVALGVASLIVVLSVMNGFENELRGRLLSLAGQASIESAGEPLPWRDIMADLLTKPDIEAVAPFIEIEAMLSSGRELAGAILTGIDPALENGVSEVSRHMRSGSLERLRSGDRGIILGRALALRLGVNTGDKVTLMVPNKDKGGGLNTRLRQFVVQGIFELGLRDHDAVRALVHLDDAAVMVGLSKSPIGVQVKTNDIFAAPRLVREWAADWQRRGNVNVKIRDWTQDNATYFRAVRIEKIIMTLLLSLIVGIAVFNIVAMLVMVVTDKRRGIAVLRTFGYSRRVIVQIFAFQGIIVGWIGVLAGISLGIMLAMNIDSLAPALEKLFGFEFMPADVYYLTALPSDLHWLDVIWVSIIALMMTAVATIYTATRAAGVAPAEVLRYE
jgi:lipoprotein-releasing system permease protein